MPPRGRSTRTGFESLLTRLMKRDSSAWTSWPESNTNINILECPSLTQLNDFVRNNKTQSGLYLALIDGRRAKVQRYRRLRGEPWPPKDSWLFVSNLRKSKERTSWREVTETCRAACLCGAASESRALQPVCCPPSRTRRKSLGGGNAATRCDLQGGRDACKQTNPKKKKKEEKAKTFRAANHLCRTIWGSRAARTSAPPRTRPPPADGRNNVSTSDLQTITCCQPPKAFIFIYIYFLP